MSKKIVAIVGRPNVGKSTLFNKLAGERIAIVDDKPGVTRDRIYAESEWLNNKFTIIDTGGIEIENEDIIKKQMRRQAQIAIETSDIILFIVDGKNGLVPADKEIALMLRKSGKPVVLVVNKIDRVDEEQNKFEFYNLGLGEPISISASQGLGLGEMLDEVLKYIKQNGEDEKDDEYIKVSFIGKPNVGKSSLVNKLVGEERNIVSNIPGTTRDSTNSYVETKNGKFILVDTAGIRRKSKVKEEVERYSVIRALASIEKCDVCVLMIDASEGISEQDERIVGYAHSQNKAIVIAVNKWDLIEKDSKTTELFKRSIRQKLSFIQFAPIIFISAKTGKRVNKILSVVKECYDNYCKRISTGVLNEVINDALMMKEPPVVGYKRLKIYYVTQVGIKPPTFVFFVNDSKAIHFSYKRYLENRLRESFGFNGTAIKFIFRERKE